MDGALRIDKAIRDQVQRLLIPEMLDNVNLLIDILGFIQTDKSSLSVCDLESSGVSAIELRKVAVT